MDFNQLLMPEKSRKIKAYLDDFKDAAGLGKGSGTFDSLGGSEFITDTVNQGGEHAVPDELKAVFDDIDAMSPSFADRDNWDNPDPSNMDSRKHMKNKVLRATLDAMDEYKAMHGADAPYDVVSHALHLGSTVTDSVAQKEGFDKATLDSLESMSAEPYSMNPNRPIITIYQSIIEAIPFGHMLPADIKSNEASLIIVGHSAASKFGTYDESNNMDGINSGGVYMASNRVHTLTDNAGTWEGKLTAQSLDAENCDPAGDEIKWLRGRTQIMVNGIPVGGETNSTGSGASPLTGVATIDSTSHILSGSFNTETGVVSASFTPALPDGHTVMAEAFIDFERNKGITPVFKTETIKHKLYAKPFRARTEHSIDAQTQFANELGINPQTESMIAMRSHYANERHYDALRKMKRIGASDPQTFNFDWSGQKTYKNHSDIWENFYGSTWGAANQQVVEDTNDFGLSYLYVGKHLLAMMQSSGDFVRSGVKPRPGIYRAGTYKDIQVYYSPHVVDEDMTAGVSHAIAIGKSNQVARNPIVMGDAVAPIVEGVSVNQDHERGMVYYARNYLEVNPYTPSARGCKLIEFTGLK